MEKQIFTKDDYQRQLQRTETIKQWAADFAAQGIAPVALIGVRADGMAAVNLPEQMDLRSVATMLREVAAMIEKTKPIKISIGEKK